MRIWPMDALERGFSLQVEGDRGRGGKVAPGPGLAVGRGAATPARGVTAGVGRARAAGAEAEVGTARGSMSGNFF